MKHDIPDDCKARQCARLLAALQNSPVSTIDARDRLNIYHAPARVHQLRKQGHKIATRMRTELDVYGRPHRVGVYILGGAE